MQAGTVQQRSSLADKLIEVGSTTKCRSLRKRGQQRHAEQIARRLDGLDQRFLDTYERVDTMSYDERRAILRQFNVQITLWKRYHDPPVRHRLGLRPR